MKILAFMGSPRLKGKCSQLTKRALEGAAEKGASTACFELSSLNIQYCRGCATCFTRNPDQPIGKCPIKDDMHSLLNEYLSADGYIYAAPVYDVFVNALTKTFLERKIMLMYRPPQEFAKIPACRRPANFRKKASFIVTGNCADALKEIMGDPCFEAFESHLLLEQIDTVDRLYVGGVENLSEEAFSRRLESAFRLGARLVEEIHRSRREDMTAFPSTGG